MSKGEQENMKQKNVIEYEIEEQEECEICGAKNEYLVQCGICHRWLCQMCYETDGCEHWGDGT
jgi:hypothetical protein